MINVTIWRQVSSNHSNGFSLVGVFPDEESAEAAYKRIQKLLKSIDKWCEKNDIDKYDNWDTLEPERQIAKELRFQWPDESPTDFGTEALARFRNVVNIESSADSWTRRKPYELMLKKMGADVAGWDSGEEDDDPTARVFQVQITASAPTEAAATKFAKKWEPAFAEKNARLKQDGLRIAISKLEFDLGQFKAIVKALETARFTDVQVQLKKKAYSPE